MLGRIVRGEVPPKHHQVFRGPDGALRHEECITREGFDGPYTIGYHLERPHTHRISTPAHGWTLPERTAPRPMAKRHYRSGLLPARGGAPVDVRTPLLFNEDVVLSVLRPDGPDPVYFSNGDGDELFFILGGSGLLRSLLGDLRFEEGDYVYVPKGVPHRFLPDEGVAQTWLSIEGLGGIGLPRQWRNETGQLRMDAPCSLRDFRLPTFEGPVDEGLRELLVKRAGSFHGFTLATSPLDLVGFDGSVYPFAFPILAFQPKVAAIHLPPTFHGTFAARGALVCSFVPRLLDFHPEALPAPYPHSNVDVDEVLFYARGEFTSRRGVEAGSISHHPAGLPHGPHPGAYEASIGRTRTDELAVMLDCYRPLWPTAAALEIEDPGYHDSFV